MRVYILGIFLIVTQALQGAEVSDIYIDKYKDIAISEMNRTGIPASIKLAQGMLESNMGRSTLAITANNHFGIKCGGTWQGKTHYREDDDRDHKGNLIESCFRHFDNDYQSYIAHSDFLSKKRYAFLFKLSKGDYKGWAKGLKKAGYATDPKYPNKLIYMIEKYDLHKYDVAPPILEKSPVKVKTKAKKEVDTMDIPLPKEKINPIVTTSVRINVKNYKKYYLFRCKYVKAKGGESLAAFAKAFDLEKEILVDYNDFDEEKRQLNTGEIVFITPKKRRYLGKEKFHKVGEGETLQSISQKYGLKVALLRVLNKIPQNAEIVAGEKLSLKKHLTKKEGPKYEFID